MQKKEKKPQRVNVEAFKRLLLARKNTVRRFSLGMSLIDAFDSIEAAYMTEVEFRHRTYIADGPTTQHINDIAVWLTSPNPKFGMLLCGQCGNGKTTLVQALRTLVAYRFKGQRTLRIVDAKEICAIAKADYERFKALCREQLLAIDDLGIEPAEILDYGNVLNPVIDLLTARYNEQLFTIVTTNLTPAQIREHYGDRIADRFNEMFSRIIFHNPTYRQ